jgi:uncharacterized membrane protein YccF (DUF307 family)
MNDDKIYQLVSMGFDTSDAERALRAAGGDVDGAVEHLLLSGTTQGPIRIPMASQQTVCRMSANESGVRYITFKTDRRGPCSWIMNLLWLMLGGWHMFATWFIAGVVLCLTLIACPCGCQVIKISCFLLCPFGKTLTYSDDDINDPGLRCCSRTCNCLLNVVWAITAGWILALQALITGILLCLTIIGIPFGWQCFKLTYLCFCPFGVEFSAEATETFAVATNYQPMQGGNQALILARIP